MALMLTIVFTSLLICTSLGTEVNVSFELEDSDVNEVIFVDETNIVLRCCVTGASNEYMIRIEHENRDDILPLAQDANCSNCLVHTIKNVSMNDGGEYTCNVSYSGSGSSMEAKAATLYLNVKDGMTPQCFRNGTEGKSYQVDDILLMSCYCREPDGSMPCTWKTSSVSYLVMKVFETASRTTKKIQRLLIQVGSSSSPLDLQYHCSNGPLAPQRCSIGPQSESSMDLIINSHAESTFTDSLDCELLSIPTVKLPEEVVTQTKITNQSTASTGRLTPASVAGRTSSRARVMVTSRKSNASTAGFNVIVIGASGGIGFALVLIIIVIIVVIFLKRKNGEEKGTGPQQNQFQDNTDQHGSEIPTKSGSTDLYYDIDLMRKASQKEDDSKSRDRAPSTANETSVQDSNLPNTEIKLPLRGTDSVVQNTFQHGLENDVSKVDIPSNDYAVVKGEAEVKEDSDNMYAKVDKNKRKFGNEMLEMLEMKPALEQHNASEGEQEFGALYAKVDKNRRSTRNETDGGKALKHEDDSDMYAEIAEV